MINLQRTVQFLRGLKAPSEYLVTYFPEKDDPSTERVCTACTHVGTPTRQMAGRADIERALWAVVLGLAIIYLSNALVTHFTTFFLFRWLYKLSSMAGKVFLVLGMAYTVIRLSIRSSTCPKCGGTEVIPLDSPRGKQITTEQTTRK